MLRLLLTLVVLGLLIHGTIDCARSRARDVRGLPKPGWLFVIIVLPVVGPLAWLAVGRPRQEPGRHARSARPASDAAPTLPPAAEPRVLGPDDDEEFLAELGRQQELRRRKGRDPE